MLAPLKVRKPANCPLVLFAQVATARCNKPVQAIPAVIQRLGKQYCTAALQGHGCLFPFAELGERVGGPGGQLACLLEPEGLVLTQQLGTVKPLLSPPGRR